ncbi:restriction endonuclease, partial [Klebsiella pneumoniae]
SHHAGFDIIWLVECKHWKNPVSKLHVLALREIVTEIGADRGILLSESGFQSGAIEAANLTNVHITSLAELSLSASKDIYSMRLRELYNQVEICN